MDSSLLITEKVDDVEENAVVTAVGKYIEQGLSVFPVKGEGKTPLVAWKPYQERVANNEELGAWFASGIANVGIVTGELSGVIVLDFDTNEAWQEAINLGMPETPLVETSRGFHAYFKHRPGIRNDQHGQVIAGMDIRGEGGYVVAPPSVHESGDVYSWFDGKSFDDVLLAELPDWVVTHVVEKPVLEELEGGVGSGERNETLARLAGSWVKEMGFAEVVTKALEWNEKCEPPLDELEVEKVAKSIWEREHAGLPEDIGLADWDEPVLFGAGDVPDIEASLLPGFLGDYGKAVSRYTQAPEALSVMVGLSVVATSLQKKFVVSPFGDSEYVEPLNLWTVTALKPSERKTPVFNLMTKPLKQWERDQREALESEISRINTERDIELKRVEALKQNAAKAEDDGDRDEIKQKIAGILSGLAEEILPPRLWTADVTPERLQQLLVDHDEKMSLMSDEGGIFEVLSGMYANGKINVDVLLQSYSGSAVRIDRGSRSAYLESPALTFGLTVQPGILRGLGQGAKKKFRDNGMLARFLYCIPKGTVGARNVRNRYTILPRAKQEYETGINRLLNLTPNTDADGKSLPHVLRVSADALEVWYDFSQEVEDRLGDDGELESLADWGGKLAGNALRIAGNFHVAKGSDVSMEIDAETMAEATNLCRALIPHAKAAFNDMGKDEDVSDAIKVYEWILKVGDREFSRRNCQRAMQSRFSSKELEPVLSELVDRNIVRSAGVKTGPGRKSDQYEVNPAVFRS